MAAAADLVLKLWSGREFIPGNVYPLKDLGKALSVLRLLELEASPFSRVSQRKTDALLAEAFDGLRILVAHGVLLTFSKLDEHLENVSDPRSTGFSGSDVHGNLLAVYIPWEQGFDVFN